MSNITNVHIVKEDNGQFDATIENSDGQVLNESFDTFEDANAWMQEVEGASQTKQADPNQQRLDEHTGEDQVAEETAASDELATENETAKAEAPNETEQGDDTESN